MSNIRVMLNKVITLRIPTRVSNDYGTSNVTYDENTSLRGAMRVLAMDEKINYGREASEVVFRFYFAGTPTIKPDYQLKLNTKIYRIIGINDAGGRGNHLQVDAIEMQA